MEDNIYRTTLNPREEKLLDEFRKYQYGVDIGVDENGMRGGLHQLTNEMIEEAIKDKKFLDGEILLPKTSFEQLDSITAEEYAKIQRMINETYGNPPIEVQPLNIEDEIKLNNMIYKDGIIFPREISEIETTVDSYETRWNTLKQKAIDYRFNKTGSHEDGRYCVAISVTDLLKWMEELEGENDREN